MGQHSIVIWPKKACSSVDLCKGPTLEFDPNPIFGIQCFGKQTIESCFVSWGLGAKAKANTSLPHSVCAATLPPACWVQGSMISLFGFRSWNKLHVNRDEDITNQSPNVSKNSNRKPDLLVVDLLLDLYNLYLGESYVALVGASGLWEERPFVRCAFPTAYVPALLRLVRWHLWRLLLWSGATRFPIYHVLLSRHWDQ